ncbi:MAG: MerR family transcriptional regulator [Hydrogenophaga sp.]|jgi:DNA-binding transcriptional MerR regulator|nr:MerR family transcriptional regulator [Hydrogenophaga sp.]
MYIGELSRRSGASRKAIYLYEEMGLIPCPLRQGNYRVYEPEVVEYIQTIRCAQSLGFKLAELAEAMPDGALRQQPDPEALFKHIEHKRLALQQQIRAAQDQLDRLDDFRKQLQQSQTAPWSCTQD